MQPKPRETEGNTNLVKTSSMLTFRKKALRLTIDSSWNAANFTFASLSPRLSQRYTIPFCPFYAKGVIAFVAVHLKYN